MAHVAVDPSRCKSSITGLRQKACELPDLSMRQALRRLQDFAHVCAGAAVVPCLGPDGCQRMPLAQWR